MSSMEMIQQEAVQRYINNLQYFKKYHPPVFKKIFLLDEAINSGQYSEKYSLEYIEEGYFDVKEISSARFLYGENSIEYSKKLANNLDKSKDKNVIEGFYRYYFTKEMVEEAKKQEAYESVESCVLPVIDFVYKYIQNKNYMKQIKKVIFLGIGLGYHINLINNSIKEPAIYLIIEDDLELFRLSLFTADYTLLEQDNSFVQFSILEDNNSFRKSFDKFFDIGYLHNTYLKYLMFTDNYKEKFKLLQTFIVGQSHMGYTYDRLLRKYMLALKPIKEDYRFLDISKHFENTIFEKKPILFLAAGASLQKNIEWVKENQNKYIIFAVYMILPTLQKEGIIPDIVIHLDEQEEPFKRVLKKVDLRDYKKTIFLFTPSIDIDWYREYGIKDRVFLFEDRTYYKINYQSLKASSVGEVGYFLSLLFGTKDIYLLGLDLAFDEESGKSHIDGHGGGMDLSMESENVSLRETYLKVKGNFRKEVVTNPLFHDSILDANIISENFKSENQNVYNLSDGAYIDKTIPLKIEEIKELKIINKDFNEIKEAFMKYSSTLTDEDLKLFSIRYKKILKKRKILNKFLKEKIKNQEDFINTFIKTAIELTITKEDNTITQIEQVLSIYLHYVGVYISDFANTAGVKYSKKDFFEFQKLLVQQLNRILTPYQKSIETIIKTNNKF